RSLDPRPSANDMTLPRVILGLALASGCVVDSKSLGGSETDTEGDDAGTSDTGPPRAVTCDPSCREIRAYPADLQRDCVDTETTIVVGCDCNPQFGGAPGCVRWEADGSLWVAENTDDLMWDENSGEPATPLDTGWVHCTSDEWQHTRWSCDFEGCVAPPASTCDATDTCE